MAFSFFYYVFLGELIKEEDKPTILRHESVHVKQNHTMDLLFFEILRIVFWFNPLIYMYQRRISSLHEFIADAEAVKSQNKKDYYQDLLSQIFETKNVSFINTFYKKSLIKKRIVMLSKAKSKQSSLLKYAILIPMIFVMLLYSSSYAQENIQNIPVQEDAITQDPIEVPFAKVEETPMLPSCENKGTQDERRDCVASEISEHVKKNFNQTLAWNLGLTGKQRITVVFKIDTNGNVVGVRSRAPHPDLEVEAIRVIKTLPHFIPGKQNGETVVVPYSLPIIFEVSDGAKVKLSDLKNANLRPVKIIETQDLSNLTEMPFSIVDEAPQYSGCENIADEKEQRKCTSDHISQFVQHNFNTDLAGKSGLTGRQRINVIFKIDTLGNVVGVRSRAAHPDLENEAERVIGLLPKMQPGKHKGKKVVVPYSLPIIFEVATNKDSKKEVPSELKDFKIVIQKTKDKIKLKCEGGCAWTELSFSLNSFNEEQAINQFGMTQLNNTGKVNDPKLANFLFIIQENEKEIKLQGIAGTAWTNLSFSLKENEKQAINQFGMIHE
jgi:hypothetical protein